MLHDNPSEAVFESTRDGDERVRRVQVGSITHRQFDRDRRWRQIAGPVLDGDDITDELAEDTAEASTATADADPLEGLTTNADLDEFIEQNGLPDDLRDVKPIAAKVDAIREALEGDA